MSMGKKGGFRHTWELLNKFLKEKKRSVGELSLEMAHAFHPKGECHPSNFSASTERDVMEKAPNFEGKPKTPRTMRLLPGLESSEDNESPSYTEPPRQMTIFYGGKMMVFENFPAERAREIMAMAGKMLPASSVAAVPSLSSANTVASTSQGALHGPPHVSVSSDNLPIARRASLNRFLGRRKDRITSKAPYQVRDSPSSTLVAVTIKEEVNQSWLGLAPLSTTKLTSDALQKGR